MSSAFIIEVADETAGIVVRLDDEKSFRFHASKPHYLTLDGRRFDSPHAAERAVRARFREPTSSLGRFM